MKHDLPLATLLDQMRASILLKDEAERARVNAEARKAKAHITYLQLMDVFHAKEYTL